MSAASAGVLATWVLSLALLLPGTPLPATSQAGFEVSRTALLALVWTALAGLPRAQNPESSPNQSWLSVCALALAPLAVALALDLATGHTGRELALTAGVASVLFVALGASAARGGTAYATLWLAIVLGAPILVSILRWGSPAPPHPALAALRSASPLAWCYDRISGAAVHPAGPLAVSAVLVALAYRSARRAS